MCRHHLKELKRFSNDCRPGAAQTALPMIKLCMKTAKKKVRTHEYTGRKTKGYIRQNNGTRDFQTAVSFL
jgi:hypothetical protein